MFKRNNGFGGKSFGKRDSGPAAMHKTSCAECGNSCEVPFKPNGKKPVLCGDCFRKDDNGGERSSFRTNDRSSDRQTYRSQERFSDRGERSFNDKPSYPATCGDCGVRCTVPFKPMQGKPVLCRDCFSGEKSAPQRSSGGMTSEQFEILNKKMDAILKAVGSYVSTPKRLTETVPEFKEEKEKKTTKKSKEKKEDETQSESEAAEEAPKAKKAWAKIKYD